MCIYLFYKIETLNLVKYFLAVWNPSSRTIPDLGENEYKQMICVAAVAPGDVDKTITLKRQEEWKGRLQISIVGSSFSSKRFQASKAEANFQKP